jgi:hypothetical protein
MACKANWNNNFLRTHLPIDWIEKEYKTHVKSILFDREKNFMQNTSDYMINYKRLLELKKDIPSYRSQIDSLSKANNEMQHELRELEKDLGIIKLHSKKNADIRKAHSEYYRKIAEIESTHDRTKDPQGVVKRQQSKKTLDEYNLKVDQINQKYVIPTLNLPDLFNDNQDQIDILSMYIFEYNTLNDVVFQNDAKSNVTSEIRSACHIEDCKGFLDKTLRCNICLNLFCKECQEVKKDNHICNPDILASIKLIKNEPNVKPCPGCGVGINKLQGCDHMWCLMCKTGFNWSTNKKIDDANNTNGEMVKFYRSKNIYHPTYNPQGVRPSGSNENQNCNLRKSYYDFLRILDSKFYNNKLLNKILVHRKNNATCPELEFFDFIKNKWFIIEFTCNLSTFFFDKDRYHIAEDTEYNSSVNHKLRLKYLNNEIDEKQFNVQAMKSYKRIEYEHEISNFVDTTFLYLNDWVSTVYEEMSFLNTDWQQALEKLQKIDWQFAFKILKQFNKNCCETSKLFNYSVYKKVHSEFAKKYDDLKIVNQNYIRNWDLYYAHFADLHVKCYSKLDDRKHLYWSIYIKNEKNDS